MVFHPGWRYAAVGNCNLIGQTVDASINGFRALFHVVDCSQSYDLTRHEQEGLIIEIDYQSSVDFFPKGEGHTDAIIWGFSK